MMTAKNDYAGQLEEDKEEELVDTLIAISVIARRLADKVKEKINENKGV